MNQKSGPKEYHGVTGVSEFLLNILYELQVKEDVNDRVFFWMFSEGSFTNNLLMKQSYWDICKLYEHNKIGDIGLSRISRRFFGHHSIYTEDIEELNDIKDRDVLLLENHHYRTLGKEIEAQILENVFLYGTNVAYLNYDYLHVFEFCNDVKLGKQWFEYFRKKMIGSNSSDSNRASKLLSESGRLNYGNDLPKLNKILEKFSNMYSVGTKALKNDHE